MLNTVLAAVAAVVWSTAYGWFFVTDVRRWWRGRRQRQAREAAELVQARLEYAAWVRDIPPPRSRVPQLPPLALPPRAAAPPARSGVVIPFPRAAASRR